MSSRSVNVDLQFPVVHNGKEVKTVTIRRPKGRDMRYLPSDESGGVEAMYPFFAMLLSANGEDLTEEFIDEMDAADIAAMSEKAIGFLERKGKKAPVRKAGAR
jgi:hypothetical protein